ncbi:Rqc2 family fibronectin-binding protein [Sporosalibacterium faouarense]|uniref:Rqc2 family fibronectin-binding protein n=1 Tax=Sporosalibacterium faouarense TaxID=516123 RepID=UPI00192ACBC8|nr:NFACT RNA binding domain-containing protein [Sporosalibacterium faouarense]
MSLDGIVTRSIIHELNEKIVDGKVDKVYQPEEDEIIINIRAKGSNAKLLISASSNNPRIYLTKHTKSNPIKPPMFCMLLRKHLQGGRITNIRQSAMDRIIHIDVQSFDELGVLSTKTLIVEIMGRHSNIILIEEENNKILDSIKRVTPDISSVRQVFPGILYKEPPSQDKLNALFIEKNTLLEKINENNEGTPLFKFIYKNYMGISPLIAREICYRAEIDSSTKLGALSDEMIDGFFSSFSDLMEKVKYEKYSPTMILDREKREVVAFSTIDIKQYSNYSKTHFDSISEVLEEYYETRDRMDRIKQKSSSLKKLITTKLDRAKNKLAKQKEELLTAEKREKYKIYGELLTANIYRIEQGQNEIEVDNFYSENNEKITISLDPRYTPSQNAQKYFKRYTKLKNAYEFVSNEIIHTKDEIEYLDHILVSIDNCTDVEELEEIREELIDEGYIKKHSKKKKKNKGKSNQSEPRHYKSSDDYDLYVGKNNKQNDYLTLKFASKDDIWLHTKDIPGSHVIIKTKGEEVPAQTIREAALLAAYYSKGKMSSNVPVDYTERRNVRKPNGAKLGMVIYENNNTIYVTPKIEEINKIKELDY